MDSNKKTNTFFFDYALYIKNCLSGYRLTAYFELYAQRQYEYQPNPMVLSFSPMKNTPPNFN